MLFSAAIGLPLEPLHKALTAKAFCDMNSVLGHGGRKRSAEKRSPSCKHVQLGQLDI